MGSKLSFIKKHNANSYRCLNFQERCKKCFLKIAWWKNLQNTDGSNTTNSLKLILKLHLSDQTSILFIISFLGTSEMM
jgi:LEA14-like dessication related protein